SRRGFGLVSAISGPPPAEAAAGEGSTGMDLTRRESLTFAAALAATACTPAGIRPAAVGTQPESLNALAKRSGRRFGSAVAWGSPGTDRGSFANPAYAAILQRECGLLVPENELKWQWTRPAPDRFDFRQFDAIADYATGHGLKLRGHTLFWTPQKWYPNWLARMQFQLRGEAERLLRDQVRTVCRRYGTRIYSCD